MNNSLSTKGLSISQAQSISNLCYQRALEINSKLSIINNYSKTVTVSSGEPNGSHTYTETQGNPIPDNIIDLLKLKSKYHACQAWLVENIKYKNRLIDSIKSESYDSSSILPPIKKEGTRIELLKTVDEDWGWSKLTVSEYNEYLEAEAYASHIGQFIHNNGILSDLREQLPTLKLLQWLEIETGKKVPLVVIPHHTQEQLFEIHEKLSKLHMQYESRVNYFKAKVKNLVTLENSTISKQTSEILEQAALESKKLDAEFNQKYSEYLDLIKLETSKFEEERYSRLQEAVSLRILVDDRFKEIVDDLMTIEE